jgi:hypothetical protein
MHVMGNVFLWLSVVLILVAITFSTMVLDVRSKWLAEVEKRQQALVQSGEELRATALRVRNLEEDLQRRVQLWGDVWTAENSRPMPGDDGRIEIGAGSAAGLGRKAEAQGREPPAVYVFSEGPDGASEYLGEFRLTDVQTDRSAARLTRRPYPQEMQAWPQGTFRVRENLPGDWRSTYADLEAQQVIAETKLRTQLLELETLNNQIRVSQASLDRRLAELNGDAEAPEGASQEVLDGLVETLRKFENERDQVLANVQRLRRQLDREYVRLRRILAGNRETVERMYEEAGTSIDASPEVTGAVR